MTYDISAEARKACGCEKCEDWQAPVLRHPQLACEKREAIEAAIRKALVQRSLPEIETLEDKIVEQAKRIEELETQLSEVVTPTTIDGESWHETVGTGPNTQELPILRGSPRLKDFISYLHMEAHNLEKALEKALQLTSKYDAQAKRIEDLEKECLEWKSECVSRDYLRRQIDNLREALKLANEACGDLAESAANDLDHGGYVHPKWYKATVKARAAIREALKERRNEKTACGVDPYCRAPS